MRLVYTHSFLRPPRPATIAQAISEECEEMDGGLAERAYDTGRKAAQLLGALVEKLHARGALSDDDVLALLPGWSQEGAKAPEDA